MKAYKVLRRNMTSFAIYRGNYCLTYAPNNPTIGWNFTPIFAFAELEDAKNLISYFDYAEGLQIWLCEGERVEIPEDVAMIYNTNMDDLFLDKFWLGIYCGPHISVPKGTIGLATCTLLERVL